MIRKLKLVIKVLIFRAIDRVMVNDLYMAYHGNEFFLVLWDLDQDFFRYHLKHNPKDLSEETLEVLDKGREMLYDLMEKYGIDFSHVE